MQKFSFFFSFFKKKFQNKFQNLNKWINKEKETSRCARMRNAILKSSQSRGETQSLRSGIYPCPRGDYILQGLYGHEFIPRSAISIFYLANVSGCLANVLRHPFRLVRHRDRCKDLPMRIALHARDSVSSPHLGGSNRRHFVYTRM